MLEGRKTRDTSVKVIASGEEEGMCLRSIYDVRSYMGEAE